MANKEKFLELVSPANDETIEAIRFREENKVWLHESKYIAIKVLKSLKDKGITQKELANQMKVTPQYVNKLIKGRENFTLETLVKLQNILDIPLLASYNENRKKSQRVQVFNHTISYNEVEYSEYNSLDKTVVGYE